MWHVLSTCNRDENRLALGSHLIQCKPTTMSIETLQRIYNNYQELLNNMINLFTVNRSRPILEYIVFVQVQILLKVFVQL